MNQPRNLISQSGNHVDVVHPVNAKLQMKTTHTYVWDMWVSEIHVDNVQIMQLSVVACDQVWCIYICVD
jgi:hypothetical protein